MWLRWMLSLRSGNERSVSQRICGRGLETRREATWRYDWAQGIQVDGRAFIRAGLSFPFRWSTGFQQALVQWQQSRQDLCLKRVGSSLGPEENRSAWEET